MSDASSDITKKFENMSTMSPPANLKFASPPTWTQPQPLFNSPPFSSPTRTINSELLSNCMTAGSKSDPHMIKVDCRFPERCCKFEVQKLDWIEDQG